MEAISFLLSQNGSEETLEVKIRTCENGLVLSVEGYETSTDKEGEVVLLDWFEDKLSLKVWSDRNQEDPTHDIDLALAKSN